MCLPGANGKWWNQWVKMLTIIGWYGQRVCGCYLCYVGISSESLKLFPNKKWGKKEWDFLFLCVWCWLIHSDFFNYHQLKKYFNWWYTLCQFCYFSRNIHFFWVFKCISIYSWYYFVIKKNLFCLWLFHAFRTYFVNSRHQLSFIGFSRGLSF